MTADDFVLALSRCLPLNQPDSQLFSPAVLAPIIQPEAEAYATTESEKATGITQNSFDGAERPATTSTPLTSAPFTSTGITSFTPPVQETPLPAGWVEFQTLGGKTYYYNKELKTTAWKRPTAGVVSSETVAAPIDPIKRMRAQKQELCTGTKAEDAKALDTQAAATVTSDDPSYSGMQAVQEEVPLPAGWVEFQTLGGKTYYYNEQLKTTAWKRPTAIKANKETSVVCECAGSSDRTKDTAARTRIRANGREEKPGFLRLQLMDKFVPDQHSHLSPGTKRWVTGRERPGFLWLQSRMEEHESMALVRVTFADDS